MSGGGGAAVVSLILNGKVDNDTIDRFYKTGIWRTKRREILKRDNKECQRCKRNGKANRAECVHHIKHLREFPHLALESSNLMSLCNSCHNIVHPEKQIKNYKKPRINIEERW